MTQRNGRPFQFYVSDEFLDRVDGWRGRRRDLPSRAEAIRHLVEVGLSSSDEWSDEALLEALRRRLERSAPRSLGADSLDEL